MVRKKYLVIIFLIILILTIFSLSLNRQVNNLPSEVCINNHCFTLETARTQEERAKGLMFRQALKEDEGMLFIFEKEDFHGFWMKNTLIPLDIIWIDKEDKIVYIQHNVQTCTSDPCPSYTSKQKAIYVLEINANLSDKYYFKEGDTINL